MKKMRKTKMRSKKNARKTKRIRGGAAQTSKRPRNSGENTDHLQNLKDKNEALEKARIALKVATIQNATNQPLRATKYNPYNDDTPEIKELKRKYKEALEEQRIAVDMHQAATSEMVRKLYTPKEFLTLTKGSRMD